MDHKLNKLPAVIASDCSNSHRTRRRRAHSFSSSLLDAICQSMDEDDSQQSYDLHNKDGIRTHSHLHLHLHPSHMKVNKQNRPKNSEYAEIVVLQAGKVAKSIQNGKSAEKAIHRVNTPSFSSSSLISNFSYSDSSSTHGPLSSSVSSYGPASGDSSSSCFSTCSSKSPKSSIREKITKAKLKAIKLYTEMKKAKANKPISPRCPLATYLNSLFTPKKQNKTEPVVAIPQKTYTKTKNITSVKNSKPDPLPIPPSASEIRPIFVDRKAAVTLTPTALGNIRHDQHQDVKGWEIFKKCQEKIVRGLKMREFVEELTDGDDAESYASSDLFELEFLMERGGEELPVFETTDIKINQAIANRYSM